MGWWWMEKLTENDESVSYAYGFCTKNATGEILVSKADNEVTRVKMADDDSEYRYKKFAEHVRRIIAKAGYPQVRSIAVG